MRINWKEFLIRAVRTFAQTAVSMRSFSYAGKRSIDCAGEDRRTVRLSFDPKSFAEKDRPCVPLYA